MKALPRFEAVAVFACSLFAMVFAFAICSPAQQLRCNPCWHAFGKVDTGSESTFNVRLANHGSTSLEITSQSVQGGEFSVGNFPLPMTLAAGSSVELPVIFAPTQAGHTTGTITLANTGQNPELAMKFEGTGAISGSAPSVYLSWQPGNGDAVGYNVYRGTANGGPYTKLNSSVDASTNYTDNTVEAGSIYYYVTTEVNAEGEESGYSNVAEAIVPES